LHHGFEFRQTFGMLRLGENKHFELRRGSSVRTSLPCYAADMADAKHVKKVKVFDLTLSGDRDDYEDLTNEATTRVEKETDFAMGGTGAVIRVVDFTEEEPPNGEFEYKKPIN
jgi:hypothetical protein